MSGSVNRIVFQTLSSRNQSPRTQSNDVSTTHDGSTITAGGSSSNRWTTTTTTDFQSRHHDNNNTELLACSPTSASFSRREISTSAFTTNDFREFLGDRKGMYDHLKPRPLIISTMRVVVLQGSVTLATFLTDQLEMETEREELVVQGKISPEEADRENEEWERREWSLRWKSYPRRAFHGILKFHAITVLMRFYEHMAHILYSEETLDKLTKDTFKSALRKADRLGSGDDNDKRELGRQMFATCLWANLISFLADYSVQQIILGYGYFVYYRQCRSRRRRKSKSSRRDEGKTTSPTSSAQNGTENNVENGDNGVKEEDEPKSETVENGAMAMSLMLKSTKLMLSRSVGLVAASAGGAVGTMLYPGWGTLFGTQMGDALVGSVLD